MASTCESSTVNLFHQVLSFFPKKKDDFFSSLDSTKFSFFGGKKFVKIFISQNWEKKKRKKEPCPQPLFFNSREI
jgi:hypothetical protein